MIFARAEAAKNIKNVAYNMNNDGGMGKKKLYFLNNQSSA
jgi:hypothetical protein